MATTLDRALTMVNQALREDFGAEGRQNHYADWKDTYDEDHVAMTYKGPSEAAKAVAELFPKQKDVHILDIAAGTGLVGEELNKLGFTNIEALDPSEPMLSVAKSKGIYRKLYCEYLTDEPLYIAQDTYDVIVSSGALGNGHVPCGAFKEMIRLVKPGGYIVMATTPTHIKEDAEYRGKLEPFMAELETNGAWKFVKREVVPKYKCTTDGVVLVYQVC